MNNTERWIIGGIGALLMALLGIVLAQNEHTQGQISDLRVQLAVFSTKLDAHMSEKHASVYTPKEQAKNIREGKP